MKSAYTYMTADQAGRLLETIERAITQERFTCAYLASLPDTTENRVQLEAQKTKIARLTQRRVMAEEHLRRAQRMEGRR